MHLTVGCCSHDAAGQGPGPTFKPWTILGCRQWYFCAGVASAPAACQAAFLVCEPIKDSRVFAEILYICLLTRTVSSRSAPGLPGPRAVHLCLEASVVDT